MARERLFRPEMAGGHDGARLTRGWRLKELLTAGPTCQPQAQKEKGGEVVLGRRGRQAGPLGPSARAQEKEKAAGLGFLRAEGMLGRREKRKREGEGKGISFFF
jgi:hypothetical protein